MSTFSRATALAKSAVPERAWRPVLNAYRNITREPLRPEHLLAAEPVSRTWGLDRGTPIERHYIERFLERHRADIRGVVCETADPRYTRRFGGEQVTHSDVLHLVAGNPDATIVGDLSTGEGIPTARFDCMIVVNTLRLIYDVRAALESCHRALKPGGVLLANFETITVRSPDGDAWESDYWRFTSPAARRLVSEVFGEENVHVEVFGNVRTATAVLYGIAAEELDPETLDAHDRDYEVSVVVRASKR